MTNRFMITRRGVPGLLVGLGASITAPGLAAGLGPRDQGIGGTGAGAGPDRETGDRGIGGTGVIGTIRRFGSIVVNDLRIAYPVAVTVRIDDTRATAADLRLGHVVEAVAMRMKGGLSTRRIDVTSEAVGPVDHVAPDSLIVLGQHVSLEALRAPHNWRAGDHVAVSGLRRLDGTIVASLIERRGGAAMRVAGPVRRDRDGDLTIGDLKLGSLDGRWLGRRLLLSGQKVGRRFEVSDLRDTAFTARAYAGPPRLLVEAYVEQGAAGLVLGSGLAVRDGPGLTTLPTRSAYRAILTTRVDRSGQLTLDAVRIESGERSGRGGRERGDQRGAGPGPEGPGPRPGGDTRGPGPAGPPGQGGPGAPTGDFGGGFGRAPSPVGGSPFSGRPSSPGGGSPVPGGFGRGSGR